MNILETNYKYHYTNMMEHYFDIEALKWAYNKIEKAWMFKVVLQDTLSMKKEILEASWDKKQKRWLVIFNLNPALNPSLFKDMRVWSARDKDTNLKITNSIMSWEKESNIFNAGRLSYLNSNEYKEVNKIREQIPNTIYNTFTHLWIKTLAYKSDIDSCCFVVDISDMDSKNQIEVNYIQEGKVDKRTISKDINLEKVTLKFNKDDSSVTISWISKGTKKISLTELWLTRGVKFTKPWETFAKLFSEYDSVSTEDSKIRKRVEHLNNTFKEILWIKENFIQSNGIWEYEFIPHIIQDKDIYDDTYKKNTLYEGHDYWDAKKY